MSAEWTWTVLSALALMGAVWGLLDAWGDLRALDERRNGRRRIAIGYIRAEAIRLLVSGAWLGVGILALLSAREAQWSIGVVVLIGTNGAILLSSILDARDRLAVRRAFHPPPDIEP